MRAVSRRHDNISQVLQSPSRKICLPFGLFWKSKSSDIFMRVNFRYKMRAIRLEMKIVSRRYNKICQFSRSTPQEKKKARPSGFFQKSNSSNCLEIKASFKFKDNPSGNIEFIQKTIYWWRTDECLAAWSIIILLHVI